MKTTTQLYFKIFLLSAIPFGLVMMAIDLADGDEFSIWKFLFKTFFFGFMMSLILVSFHRYRLKKVGAQEITDDNIGVNQTRHLTTDLTKSEIINKLKADPYMGIMKMKEIEDGVILTSGMTWKSWGEVIKIVLIEEKDNGFVYQISSSPKWKTTLIDYGKNYANVNRIEGIIRA